MRANPWLGAVMCRSHVACLSWAGIDLHQSQSHFSVDIVRKEGVTGIDGGAPGVPPNYCKWLLISDFILIWSKMRMLSKSFDITMDYFSVGLGRCVFDLRVTWVLWWLNESIGHPVGSRCCIAMLVMIQQQRSKLGAELFCSWSKNILRPSLSRIRRQRTRCDGWCLQRANPDERSTESHVLRLEFEI